MEGGSEPVDWQRHYVDLLFERAPHGVLVITMNRPERANAMDARLHDEIGRVWRDVDADPAVAVAIITGAGNAFSSGGEVGTFDIDGTSPSW